jgi:hypothetical protein
LNEIARMAAGARAEIFAETADRKGVAEAIIEKDFWVCWTLRQLFSMDTHEFRPWHVDEIQSVMQAKAKARESASQAERRAALAGLATYDQEIGI